MLKRISHLRVTALAAVAALSLSAGPAAADPDLFWFGAGDSTYPNGQGWVTGYGECWNSLCKKQTDLPPCVVASVPARVTVAINFEFDKYLVPDNVVNTDAIRKIDEYLDVVKKSPEEEYITVVGHTDAAGSDAYNMALGQRRADAVRDYMIRQGYPEGSLGPAESMGKRDLLPDVDPFSVEQRRVVLQKREG